MEEKKLFCYTFSQETTKRILSGEAFLGPGGAKLRNGRMLELGRPMILSKNDNELLNFEKDKEMQRIIASHNKQLDLYDQKLAGIQKTLWLNNAALQQLSTITFDGFSCVIDRIDAIADDLKSIQKSITETHQNERMKEFWKCIAKLKSDIDYMSMKSFNASKSFMTMKDDIGDIMSFLAIINKEFLEGTIDGEMALSIIFTLLQPYAFVVKNYSALYFYENGKYPMAYENWVEIINEIAKNQRFKNRMIFWARLEMNMSLEDKLLACKRAASNLRAIGTDVIFDREYALEHTEEEYRRREDMIIEKIEKKEYELIDGHILVAL